MNAIGQGGKGYDVGFNFIYVGPKQGYGKTKLGIRARDEGR